MVNLVAAYKQLLHGLMKMAGLRQQSVEIEPGTVMNFWAPSPSRSKRKKHKEVEKKVAVVLAHGFVADGIFTWQFQVGALTSKYDVYIPDLLFFGESTTSSTNRSPAFQAQCLAKALQFGLGVHSCIVVGFSYGGIVAFNMAQLYPSLVSSLVISGSVPTMTDSINQTIFGRFGSYSDLLLPSDVKGVKTLFSIGAYNKIWIPNRLYRDSLQVMFTNRKEKGELLDGLVISNKDATIPNFSQTILLLWGEKDKIFDIAIAKNLKEQLEDKATLKIIKKAGHLVHLERPRIYNRCLKEFLARSVRSNGAQ